MKYKLVCLLFTITLLLLGCSTKDNVIGEEAVKVFQNNVDKLEEEILDKDEIIKELEKEIQSLEYKNNEMNRDLEQLTMDCDELKKELETDKSKVETDKSKLDMYRHLKYIEYEGKPKRFVVEVDLREDPANDSKIEFNYFSAVVNIQCKVKDPDGIYWVNIQNLSKPSQTGWVKEEELLEVPDLNIPYSSQSIGGIHIGDSLDTVVSILGSDYEKSYEGIAVPYYYNMVYEHITVGIEIYTDKVVLISTESDQYETEIGVKVGDKATEVLKQYLENYEQYYDNRILDAPSIDYYDLGDYNYYYINWGNKGVYPEGNDTIQGIDLYNGYIMP